MKAQLKEALRQIKVAWALSGIPTYPQELPNPPLGLIDERQAAIIDGLESVCLFLGPYRNLTTLTASMLSLHPECQVLNHAGTRVFPNKNLNFIEEY
ncbi:MAG: hypothetical protein KIS80_08075, partial [Anaerolineales bacterium]|nr:hypothetical protein [Anaerolineales bacterium]